MQSLAETPAAERPLVLVVDDERGPREALRLILQSDFRVAVAETAEDALDRIAREFVDVVTLDLKMPQLSGQATLEIIRRMHSSPEVVVVTGYGSFESAVEALRLRAFDYIKKPFDAGRILDVVRRAADERRRRLHEDSYELDAPLEDALEATRSLEASAGPALSEADRRALGRLRASLRILRRFVRPRPAEPVRWTADEKRDA